MVHPVCKAVHKESICSLYDMLGSWNPNVIFSCLVKDKDANFWNTAERKYIQMYFITITERYTTPNTFSLLLKLEEREKMVVLFISQFFVCYDYLLCLRSRFFVFWVGTSSNSFFSCSSVMRCNSKLTLSFEMLHMQCIFDSFPKRNYIWWKEFQDSIHNE